MYNNEAKSNYRYEMQLVQITTKLLLKHQFVQDSI